mgnify:CR=1 FL=1
MKIKNSRQKKFQLKILGSEYPVYHNFEMCLLAYINSSKLKFMELYQ